MSIRIFTTTNCPACDATKKFLKARNTSFVELNVEKNDNAAREMIKISGQMSVPVLDINGKIVAGFNRNAIDKALNGSY